MATWNPLVGGMTVKSTNFVPPGRNLRANNSSKQSIISTYENMPPDLNLADNDKIKQ